MKINLKLLLIITSMYFIFAGSNVNQIINSNLNEVLNENTMAY